MCACIVCQHNVSAIYTIHAQIVVIKFHKSASERKDELHSSYIYYYSPVLCVCEYMLHSLC